MTAGLPEAQAERGPLDLRALDALRELASIGCGHAVTALARLTRLRVDMDVPEAWVGRAPGAIADFLGSLDRDLVAVGFQLHGVLSGHLVLVLTEPDARRLARALGHPVAEAGWDVLSESALRETGNIVASAFASAIANMMGERLLPSTPELARGGGRECLDGLLDRASGKMALATRFTARCDHVTEGLILVVPDEHEVATLLATLGFSWK